LSQSPVWPVDRAASWWNKLSSQLSMEWQSDSYIWKQFHDTQRTLLGIRESTCYPRGLYGIAMGNQCVAWRNTCLYQGPYCLLCTWSSYLLAWRSSQKMSRYKQSVQCGRNIMGNRPILEGEHDDAWTTDIQTGSMRIQTAFHGLLHHLTFICWISFSGKTLKQSYTMLRESGNNWQVTCVCFVPLWLINYMYFVFRGYSRHNRRKRELGCCDSQANCSLNWAQKHTAKSQAFRRLFCVILK
jgi:hypothetical protein